jgi:hypothetical protein
MPDTEVVNPNLGSRRIMSVKQVAMAANGDSVGVSSQESMSQINIGGEPPTPMEPPNDLIYGWNWKESMPNAVVSQLTTFLCLWAVERDYSNSNLENEKNPRVRYWKDLITKGYDMSGQVKNLIDYGDGQKDIPYILPINKDYTCRIDGTPVKYLPALPNIAQVLTKDAKGGVGIDRISLQKPYSSTFTIDITLTISNAYEFMEQSSFWRFFTPGQWFLLTLGWQDEGQGCYNPISHEDSGELSNRFLDFPTKTVIPPIIDPSTQKLNEFFWDIDTTSPRYLFPAFGFWQSFLCQMAFPSFTIEGSSIHGSMKLYTPGAFVDKQLMIGQFSPGISKFINENKEDVGSMWSYQNADINFESGEYSPDSVEAKQMQTIRLGGALESIIRTHNSLLYQPQSDMKNQNVLIYFSQKESPAIGDEMPAPLLEGNGPMGKCNFWIGVADPKVSTLTNGNIEESENQKIKLSNGKELSIKKITAKHVNQVRDHLLHREEYKVQGVYWMESDQKNFQQAFNKKLQTLAEDIKTIADIPLHYNTFKRFVEDNRAYNFEDFLQKFCDQFLREQTGFFFELYKDMSNIRYLSFSDQFYKGAIQDSRSKIAQRVGMPALEFNRYILDEFRWKHFVLRYGDFQSLIVNVTILQGSKTQNSRWEFKAFTAGMKSFANMSGGTEGGADPYLGSIMSETFDVEKNKDLQSKTGTVKRSGNTDDSYSPESGTQTSVGNPGQKGATNAANSGLAGRNEIFKALLELGVSPDMNMYTSVGSYMKGWFDKIHVTLHGTFGLFDGMLIYFVGMFEWMRGFYHLLNVSHEVSRGDFTTTFELVWMGNDAFADSPTFLYYDPKSQELVVSNDDYYARAVKKDEDTNEDTNTTDTNETPVSESQKQIASLPRSTPE